MDFGFYKRASRGIKHKAAAAMPFYPRKPAQVAPAAAPAQKGAAVSKAKQLATTTVWSVPAPPPSSTAAATATEVGGGNGVAPSSVGGGSNADVDRLAALYISRVQERLRRERMADDWRMYY
ncbi:unnamed protein product [Urochloa decumbens]|uniref:Uncharacterized protein n=1 Tax=Urochloa decumbens TaxID=240449 RepID=A0ABC9D7J4_9POAL